MPGRLEGAPPGPPGRRMPGGGGIGRPEGLIGRPGGGGIGRPLCDSGGRFAAGASAPSPVGRCVGRMVVGPSLGVTRGAGGLGATAGRLRTTRGASAAGAGDSSTTDVVATAGAGVAGTCTSAGSAGVDLAGRAPLALVGSSGATSRRRPSLSTLRRMRSAWASSMEADGLEAPMPNVWASASNSLLVRPSSFESSCTRIFFCAKTFPCFVCSQSASTILYSSTTTTVFERRTISLSATASFSSRAHLRARDARAGLTPAAHSPSRHHQTPRPAP